MALLADNAIPYEFLFNLTQAGRCRPPGAKLTSVDVHRLSIEVIERVLEYAPETYAEWRDPDWWEAEAWRDFIPRSEWHRVLTHMKNQAIGGYHFVEVMYMRVVEAEGLNWEYESYDFFEPPTGRAARSDSGYAKVVAAFGEKKVARLQEAAGRYRLAHGDLAATPGHLRVPAGRSRGDARPFRRSEAQGRNAAAPAAGLGAHPGHPRVPGRSRPFRLSWHSEDPGDVSRRLATRRLHPACLANFLRTACGLVALIRLDLGQSMGPHSRTSRHASAPGR